MAKRPYVNVNMAGWMEHHGLRTKRKLIFHETISHDRNGLSDITSVGRYIGKVGYGVHVIVDQEGKSGYAPPERAVYYQAKPDSSQSIGIELVSFIPALNISRWGRIKIWLSRERQLHKAARWAAYFSSEHPIPLVYSTGKAAGITSHWNISEAYHVAGGHWDCKPKHEGGHFPIKRVIKLARLYKTGRIAHKPMKRLRLGKST